LDLATRDRIAGWARDGVTTPGTDPRAPVALQILDNGLPIARVLANRARDDLSAAGIGDGRHGFDIVIPGGLSPLARHVIQVRREADGAELAGSPAVIEAASGFDASLRQAVASAVAAAGPADDRDHMLSFMLAQADRLLQQRADAVGRRAERLTWRQFHRRWGPLAENAPLHVPEDTPGYAPANAPGADAGVAADPGLRALVIDERVPVAARDAGSQAILSHMRALQRLGYEVSFVAADEMAVHEMAHDAMTPGGPPRDASPVAALETAGVTCCGSPFYASAEDLLRRQAECFDVVYLHRSSIATRYLGLARRYMPRARILYSVADLHHVRLERQAAIEARPELLAAARRARLEECVAAWSADAVITHSTDEADLLRRAVPEASVYRVPWEVPGGVGAVVPRVANTAADGAKRRVVPARAAPVRFASRCGVAFIGSYAHAPNVDAACWLVEAVMPLVWQADPTIECLLVGSDMPEAVRCLAGPGVMALGHVTDLGGVLQRVRLTVAPLRYGAGVKGKVLDSMAAGVPCVMTPVAAEGLGLPASLRALVGEDAVQLASLICRLHGDAEVHRKAADAGRALIRENHNEAAVTAALQAAIEGRGVQRQPSDAGSLEPPSGVPREARTSHVAGRLRARSALRDGRPRG
jgi:hypothetical protein